MYSERARMSLRESFSKRLQAEQCLSHPWLIRRPKSISLPTDEETAEKKISTKKLRRFVIRRRWQVRRVFAFGMTLHCSVHFQKAVNALLALQRMGMTL